MTWERQGLAKAIPSSQERRSIYLYNKSIAYILSCDNSKSHK
jgi:hypothetical protein